jgi:hypothetical protein
MSSYKSALMKIYETNQAKKQNSLFTRRPNAGKTAAAKVGFNFDFDME